MSTLVNLSERTGRAFFQRILVATDLSETSRHTLAYAVLFARIYGSELILAHTLVPNTDRPAPLPPVLREFDTDRIKAERELEQLANAAHLEKLPHRQVVEEGLLWESLDDLMHREDVDLLVLGHHGGGGLKRLFFGSPAEELLNLASCPVLTVGADSPALSDNASGFRTILYVADVHESAHMAFPYALSLAEQCGAKLVLLRILSPHSVLDIGPGAFGPQEYVPKGLRDWQTRAREREIQRLKALVPAKHKLGSEPEYVVERAFVSDGILATAYSYSADLVVIEATKSRSPRLASHLPGESVHEVICHAKCPVLTVRN